MSRDLKARVLASVALLPAVTGMALMVAGHPDPAQATIGGSVVLAGPVTLLGRRGAEVRKARSSQLS